MRQLLMLLAMVAVLAGCEARETFVLLPNGGAGGAISVTGNGASRTIDAPWAAVDVEATGAEPRLSRRLLAADVGERFSAALGQQPIPPITKTLYFETGTATLTEPSRLEMVDVVVAILDRPLPDVSVVGHTDRAGDKNFNLALSKRRAVQVRDLLVGMGINPEIIDVSSHGENNPVVPTADNVPEPRNRRVEVTVR